MPYYAPFRHHSTLSCLNRASRALGLAAGLLGALVLNACTKSEADNLEQPTPLPVAAAALAPAEPEAELVLSGEITADGNRTARVFPLVGGQVLRVNVDLGDEVRAGQVLAQLKSGAMAELQRQTTAGTADLTVARKNLTVARELYENGLGAEQEVYRAEKELARAIGNTTRNEHQRSLYQPGPDALYQLRAPVAGFITEKHLAAGMRFTPANVQSAFTIVGLDSVLVMANVFESELSRVHQGQAVSITTLSYPDQPLAGRIDRVFNLLDPSSKTLRVRCILPNPGHRLKPGMHAQVRLLAAVPTQAPAQH